MVQRVHKYADGGKVVKRETSTKMADGGKAYGAPLSTPAPGGASRGRPRVGDRSSDTSRLNPKQRTPSAPATPKPKNKPLPPGRIPEATKRRLRDNDVE